MSKFPNWLIKISLSLGSILICFVILEFMLRIVVPKPDPILRTDRSKTFFFPAESRMHPYVKQDASQKIRIAVIGDSFTQGAAVQEVDTFARKLECFLNLNETEPTVEVDNYGRPGTSTFQQIERLDRAMKDNPDIVILEITLNDTEDWVDPKTIKKWRDEIIPSKPPAIVRPIYNHSLLLQLMYGKYSNAKSKAAFVQYYKNIYDPEYSGWRRFVNALRIFKEKCDAAGKPLVVVVFPLFSHSLNPHLYPFAEMHTKIHEQLEADQIDYLDLFPSFQNLNNVRFEAITGIDPHPSEIAHRMAAEEILEYLFAKQLVPQNLYPTGRSHPGIHEQWQKTYERMTLQNQEESSEKPKD